MIHLFLGSLCLSYVMCNHLMHSYWQSKCLDSVEYWSPLGFQSHPKSDPPPYCNIGIIGNILSSSIFHAFFFHIVCIFVGLLTIVYKVNISKHNSKFLGILLAFFSFFQHLASSYPFLLQVIQLLLNLASFILVFSILWEQFCFLWPFYPHM